MKHVYPVIHHLDYATSRSQVGVAFNNDADGVFLISHGGKDTELLELAHDVKQAHRGKKIGLNLLGFDYISAYHLCCGLGLDMMWTDYAGISSKGYDNTLGEELQWLFWATNEMVEVFASVAFKYQAPESDPSAAAKVARDLHYIPTTSGPGTGYAPDVGKIESMVNIYTNMGRGGNLDLAIASGMTPENVHLFLPYTTHFLVSTGISSDAYHLDPVKLQQFCDIVHAAVDSTC